MRDIVLIFKKDRLIKVTTAPNTKDDNFFWDDAMESHKVILDGVKYKFINIKHLMYLTDDSDMTNTDELVAVFL